MTDTNLMLEVLVRAARLGGRLALSKFDPVGARIDVDEKGARDYQTEADRAVEKVIVAEITSALPEVAIVGEENVANRPGSGSLTVLIDPIDGTTNFAWGIPFFSVSIALKDGSTTIAGVVHDPLRDETFAAAQDAGCYLSGRPLVLGAGRDIEHAVVGAGIPVPGQLRSIDRAVFEKAIWRLADRASAFRRMGSAALSIAYVAAGRHDAFFEDGLLPHDYAAAALCVKEAGGFVTGFDGGPIPQTGAVLAASPTLHSWLVEGFATQAMQD